jgi:uncharacterized repeat protein (TIGR01451 family)
MSAGEINNQRNNMKTGHQIILTALCLTATLFAPAETGFAQGDSQIQYNHQYRSAYDVPPGKFYSGRAPFMRSVKTVAAPGPAVVEPCWSLVTLSKSAPAAASVGETFNYDITSVANCDVIDVVIKDVLPDGASYVRSEPAATQEGDILTWKISKMSRGETRSLHVWVTAGKVGELVNCAGVTAMPSTCASTMIGKPELAIQKVGPETAQLGADVTYNIVVRNTGNSVARSVVVTDPVPEGLVSATGQKDLVFNVGDLAAGGSTSIPVTFKTDRRGKVCNTATASSSNAGKVDAEACTVVVQPGLKITKTGDKMQYLGRVAKYEINVVNTGDTALNNVMVTDTAAAATAIVSAEGADMGGGKAVWNLGTLAPGAQKTLNAGLTSTNAGEYCNTAEVATAEGLRDSAQACTVWKGIAAILLEKKDDPDPVGIGETTTYTVKVTNQGSAEDNNVQVVVTIAPELAPVSASGDGSIDGQTVTFPPVPRLAAKDAVTYTIVAKGVKAGDGHTRFKLTSDFLSSPVLAEESTTVY